MFQFGKRKNKIKEKVPPTSERERGDRPLIPRPPGMHIVERLPILDAPSSDDDSAEATPLPDITDINTQFSEDAIDASTSRNQFKAYVQPDGHFGFLPSKPAVAACTKVIRQRYNQSWLTWREIPHATRQIWFREFQADVWWDVEYTEQIWKAFNSRCSKRLSSMLSDARAVGQRPTWISEILWSELLVKWSTEEYKFKCEKSKNKSGIRSRSLRTRWWKRRWVESRPKMKFFSKLIKRKIKNGFRPMLGRLTRDLKQKKPSIVHKPPGREQRR